MLDNQPWKPAHHPTISWKTNNIPYSEENRDIYYSNSNGIDESNYYFINSNDLHKRFKTHTEERFCIGELGFGSGLNFLLTWLMWSNAPYPKPKLSYCAAELNPMSLEDLKKANNKWPQLSHLLAELIEKYPVAIKGQHRILLNEGNVHLDLWWCPADIMCDDLSSYDRSYFDAWYLDGFAPRLNPSMWSSKLITSIAKCSKPSATFGTFTSSGDVRRALEQAGFEVIKQKGFAKKRNCLKGRLLISPTNHSKITPWDISNNTNEKSIKHAVVIGAGLSGAHIAAALNRRGIEVDVVDSDKIAAGGSGNNQAILYARLSTKHSLLTDFSLQALIFSSSIYSEMFFDPTFRRGEDGDLCGAFVGSEDTELLAYLKDVLGKHPEIAEVLDHKEASNRLGIEVVKNGYWLSASGWMHPPSICKNLLERPGINSTLDCGKVTVRRQGGMWFVKGEKKFECQTNLVVLAAGDACKNFLDLNWLPLRTNIGQTTQLRSSNDLSQLKAVFCHDGYIAPTRFGEHCIGSTYHLDKKNVILRNEDHLTNIEKLRSSIGKSHDLKILETDFDGWVGRRCTSPDYLPIVGPVPILSKFNGVYSALSKNAKLHVPEKAPTHPGLYISTGHGSRGLTYSAISAEILASNISGEPPPVSRRLMRAISPARFLIREIIKRRS